MLSKIVKPHFLILFFLPTLAVAGLPLTSWFSPSRHDHFNSDWTGTLGQVRSPDYRMYRVEGEMIELERYNSSSMILLALWYNDEKQDNALLPAGMNPGSGYRHVKNMGAAYKTSIKIKGMLPLYIWHNLEKNDYLTTTSYEWAANKGAPNKNGYRFIGKAGYIVAPFKQVKTLRVKVPIKVYFEWDAVNPDGQFTFGPGKHTFAEIQQKVNLLNARLAEASGADARRLEFFIENVQYMQWVKQRGCEIAKSMVDQRESDKGTIILYITDKCNSANWGVDFAYANEVSLIHETGHIMGLYHTFDGNTTYVSNSNWGKAEPLVRNPDPTAANSCFIVGDRICDTMADYKIHDTDDNACVTTRLPCVQNGPVCDPTDLVFDRTEDCQSRTTPAAYGVRTYDHDAPTSRINIMSYRAGAYEFTYQQFLVMYSSAKWRGRLGHDVAVDEKHIIREPGNLVPGLWSRTPTSTELLRLFH